MACAAASVPILFCQDYQIRSTQCSVLRSRLAGLSLDWAQLQSDGQRGIGKTELPETTVIPETTVTEPLKSDMTADSLWTRR